MISLSFLLFLVSKTPVYIASLRPQHMYMILSCMYTMHNSLLEQWKKHSNYSVKNTIVLLAIKAYYSQRFIVLDALMSGVIDTLKFGNRLRKSNGSSFLL
jgi:hypothetical protein